MNLFMGGCKTLYTKLSLSIVTASLLVGNIYAKEVVFVDKGISDYQTITKELNRKYHLIDSLKDGLVQISNILKNEKNLDSIHIISHGNSGELLLGNSKIDSTNLNNYIHELNTIKTSLKDSGDILLYGCNVASGEKGKAFIDSFATLSGADIAASTNLTGNDKLGGDLLYRKEFAFTCDMNARSCQSGTKENSTCNSDADCDEVATTHTVTFNGNGSSWNSVGSSMGSYVKEVELAFSPDYTPYIVYKESSPVKTVVKKYNGSAWVSVANANSSVGVE